MKQQEEQQLHQQTQQRILKEPVRQLQNKLAKGTYLILRARFLTGVEL
jgi:anti-sigma28 factor (negative regulator of flagellin synthesis)